MMIGGFRRQGFGIGALMDKPAVAPGGTRSQAGLEEASYSFFALRLREDNAQQFLERVVEAVYHALLEGDNRVVGDVDVLGADFGAALGDIAVAEAELVFEERDSVPRVERVHF